MEEINDSLKDLNQYSVDGFFLTYVFEYANIRILEERIKYRGDSYDNTNRKAYFDSIISTST